jgi:hypothetical protein
MKNLSCYIMAVSMLVSACGDSSDETTGTGGSSSSDGTGGAQAGTGGASDTPSPGGSAGTEPDGAAGASTGAVGESGVALSAIVVDLGESDVDKLCDWMASTLGLVAGATPENTWASGTWNIESCDDTNESVFMWASPQRCRVDLPSANAVGCLTLDVEGFEACLTETADDLCRIDDVAVCQDFDTCFVELVRE